MDNGLSGISIGYNNDIPLTNNEGLSVGGSINIGFPFILRVKSIVAIPFAAPYLVPALPALWNPLSELVSMA